MPDITWKPCPPPEPGVYLTRRDLNVDHLPGGITKIKASILLARFDGERWNLPAQPDYYRAMPEGVKR